MALRTDFTNDTVQQNTHPGAHNQTNAAVNTLTTDVATLQTDVGELDGRVDTLEHSATARAPRGQLTATHHAGGTILQGTPLSIATPSLQFGGRYVRVTFICFARSTTGATTMEVTLTAPGTSGVLIGRYGPASGGAGSVADLNRIAMLDLVPNADGTVSISIANQTATNQLIVTSVAILVDDMGGP